MISRSFCFRLAMAVVMIVCGLAIWTGGPPATGQPVPTEERIVLDDGTVIIDDAAGARTSSRSAVDESRQDLLASLTIFVLAIFVGFEVITKVPPTLHTPLMSGSNAISGITIVGALIVTGVGAGRGLSPLLGFLAVILAAINVVGGFLVTHRMLVMFQRR